MPIKSNAQLGAMYAAAEGKSTLGIPKKVGKEAARKAWAKANPDLATVLNALEWQKVSPQWFKNNGQYIPNPSTWLNQHRFLDEKPQEQSF